jgi:hypothetical protein
MKDLCLNIAQVLNLYILSGPAVTVRLRKGLWDIANVTLIHFPNELVKGFS